MFIYKLLKTSILHILILISFYFFPHNVFSEEYSVIIEKEYSKVEDLFFDFPVQQECLEFNDSKPLNKICVYYTNYYPKYSMKVLELINLERINMRVKTFQHDGHLKFFSQFIALNEVNNEHSNIERLKNNPDYKIANPIIRKDTSPSLFVLKLFNDKGAKNILLNPIYTKIGIGILRKGSKDDLFNFVFILSE